MQCASTKCTELNEKYSKMYSSTSGKTVYKDQNCMIWRYCTAGCCKEKGMNGVNSSGYSPKSTVLGAMTKRFHQNRRAESMDILQNIRNGRKTQKILQSVQNRTFEGKDPEGFSKIYSSNSILQRIQFFLPSIHN